MDFHRLAFPSLLLFSLLGAMTGPRGENQKIRTPAEESGYTRTSTCAEAWAHLDALMAAYPAAGLKVETFGRTGQGRRMRVVNIPSLGKNPARVLIIANIHGGEVDGKEAMLEFFRELCQKQHDDLRKRLDLHIVPIFNADGNEEISRGNRVSQNGPDGGVGRRTNAQDLDLNRDFVKVESREARALLRLANKVDPHLFMDLHTTNGSHHGYHLTYAPSVSINLDPDLEKFVRHTFIPNVREQCNEGHGLRTFDYGNFPPRGEKGWYTFSADTRLAWNYMGLRNCVSVLSESYSYLSLKDRVWASKFFVLENLRALVRHENKLKGLCDQADARCVAGESGLTLNSKAKREPPTDQEVLVGSVERMEIEGLGTRLIASKEYKAEQMPTSVHFVSGRQEPMPAGWVIVDPPEEVLDTLLVHGVRFGALDDQVTVPAWRFEIQGLRRSPAPFQGHRIVRMSGQWTDSQDCTFPKGALFVFARQPLCRVAGQLLDPSADDSLFTWGFFDEQLKAADGEASKCPVYRVAIAIGDLGPVSHPTQGRKLPGLLPLALDNREHALTIKLMLKAAGRRVADRGYEVGAKWVDRVMSYEVEGRTLDTKEALIQALAETNGARTILLAQGKMIIPDEIDATAELLQKQGFTNIMLLPYEE